MSFAPPLFKDIGKALSDLFSKKYASSSSVKVQSKTDGGVSFQTTLAEGQKGTFKTKFYQPDLKSTVEEEVTTCGSLKLSVTNDNQLVEGAKFKVTADVAGAKGVVDATYRRDAIVATLVVDASADQQSAKASVVGGFSGVSAGAEVAYDVTGGDVTEVNAGGQYEHNDGESIIAVRTADKANALTLSVFHRLCSKTALGASAQYKIEEDEHLITVGGEHAFDATNLVRATVNHQWKARAVFEHRLAKPNVTFGITTAFDLEKASSVPEEYGLSIIFGSSDIK